MRRRLILVACSAAFVFTVWLANWLVSHYGPIRVWPTELQAPAGVYVVGLAFLLRDTVQRFAGAPLALVLIGVGAGLSVLVSPRLALASALAFAASEATGLVLFKALGGQNGGPRATAGAVTVAQVAAAALDSYVFLAIAFGSLAFFEGQFVAKVSVGLLALPFVLGARRRWPSPVAA